MWRRRLYLELNVTSRVRGGINNGVMLRMKAGDGHVQLVSLRSANASYLKAVRCPHVPVPADVPDIVTRDQVQNAVSYLVLSSKALFRSRRLGIGGAKHSFLLCIQLGPFPSCFDGLWLVLL